MASIKGNSNAYSHRLSLNDLEDLLLSPKYHNKPNYSYETKQGLSNRGLRQSLVLSPQVARAVSYVPTRGSIFCPRFPIIGYNKVSSEKDCYECGLLINSLAEYGWFAYKRFKERKHPKLLECWNKLDKGILVNPFTMSSTLVDVHYVRLLKVNFPGLLEHFSFPKVQMMTSIITHTLAVGSALLIAAYFANRKVDSIMGTVKNHIKDWTKRVQDQLLQLENFAGMGKTLLKIVVGVMVAFLVVQATKQMWLPAPIVKVALGFDGDFDWEKVHVNTGRNFKSVPAALAIAALLGGCSIAGVARYYRTSKTFADDALSWVDEALNYINALCHAKFGYGFFELNEVDKELNSLEEIMQSFTIDAVELTKRVEADREFPAEVTEYLERAKSLRHLTSSPKYASIRQRISVLVNYFVELNARCVRSNAKYVARTKGYLLFMPGKPGAGKNYTGEQLFTLAAKLGLGKELDRSSFVSRGSDTFFKPMSHASVCVFEEIGASKDISERAARLSEVLEMIGTSTMPLKSASITDKDTNYFAGIGVLAYTNMENFNGCGLESPQAMCRRIYVPLEIVRKGDFEGKTDPDDCYEFKLWVCALKHKEYFTWVHPKIQQYLDSSDEHKRWTWTEAAAMHAEGLRECRNELSFSERFDMDSLEDKVREHMSSGCSEEEESSDSREVCFSSEQSEEESLDSGEYTSKKIKFDEEGAVCFFSEQSVNEPDEESDEEEPLVMIKPSKSMKVNGKVRIIGYSETKDWLGSEDKAVIKRNYLDADMENTYFDRVQEKINVYVNLYKRHNLVKTSVYSLSSPRVANEKELAAVKALPCNFPDSIIYQPQGVDIDYVQAYSGRHFTYEVTQLLKGWTLMLGEDSINKAVLSHFTEYYELDTKQVSESNGFFYMTLKAPRREKPAFLFIPDSSLGNKIIDVDESSYYSYLPWAYDKIKTSAKSLWAGSTFGYMGEGNILVDSFLAFLRGYAIGVAVFAFIQLLKAACALVKGVFSMICSMFSSEDMPIEVQAYNKNDSKVQLIKKWQKQFAKEKGAKAPQDTSESVASLLVNSGISNIGLVSKIASQVVDCNVTADGKQYKSEALLINNKQFIINRHTLGNMLRILVLNTERQQAFSAKDLDIKSLDDDLCIVTIHPGTDKQLMCAKTITQLFATEEDLKLANTAMRLSPYDKVCSGPENFNYKDCSFELSCNGRPVTASRYLSHERTTRSDLDSMCGTPYIIETKQGPRIASVHVASNDKISYSLIITKEMLEGNLETYELESELQPFVNGSEGFAPKGLLSLGQLDKPFPMNKCTGITPSRLVEYGQLGEMELVKRPSVAGITREGSAILDLRAHQFKYDKGLRPASIPYLDSLELANPDIFIRGFHKPVSAKLLTISEACFGNGSYVYPVDTTTSVGPYHLTNLFDYQIRKRSDVVDKQNKLIEPGFLQFLNKKFEDRTKPFRRIILCNDKNEVRKMKTLTEKVGDELFELTLPLARKFYNGCFHDYLLDRVLLGDYISRAQTNVGPLQEDVIGINPHGMSWAIMVRQLKTKKHLIMGDIAGNDHNQPESTVKDLNRLIEKAYGNLYSTEHFNTIQSLQHVDVIEGRDVFAVDNVGTISGVFSTGVFNGVGVTSTIKRVYYMQLLLKLGPGFHTKEPFHKHCILKSNGDDFAMSVDDFAFSTLDFNLITLIEKAKLISGLTITPIKKESVPQKEEHWNDLELIQRKDRVELINGVPYHHGVLNKDSIIKSLYFEKESKSEHRDDVIDSCLQSAALEYMHHGKEEFSNFVSLIKPKYTELFPNRCWPVSTYEHYHTNWINNYSDFLTEHSYNVLFSQWCM